MPVPERIEAEDPGWCESPVRCEFCGHRWVAVYPATTRSLECGRCGQFTQAPVWYVEEGKPAVERN